MILQGSQRGGAKDLALHLLNDENEQVEVHELRGFVSDDLVSALAEINAISKGTHATQPLFSLSLNPPLDEAVSTEAFIKAIEQVEKTLGFEDQPRAIVFHEKEGPHGYRRHAHTVWSRIDAKDMKAIPLPYTHYKLQDLSRELYIEHGWTMPRGFINSQERDPKNFTLAQWQQAKRIGKDPRAIKTALQDSWAISDSQRAFQQALKERGYVLARGDRRGFVAMDHRCEVYSIPKWVGLKTKDVRARLTDKENLPSVDEAKQQIAHEMAQRMSQLQRQEQAALQNRLAQVASKTRRLAQEHKDERAALKATQEQRWFDELRQRQARYSQGLKALLDRVTGRHNQIKKQNEMDTLAALNRDQQERDNLIFKQMDQRVALKARLERLLDYKEQQKQARNRDLAEYKAVQENKKTAPDLKPEKRKSSPTVEAFKKAQTEQTSTTDFRDKMKNRNRNNNRRLDGER